MKSSTVTKLICFALITLGSCATAVKDKHPVSADSADMAFIRSFDFIIDQADTIIDPTNSLTPFYQALGRIASQGNVVPIIHFGDSHIQGGALSMTVMRRFASHYGSAGRGLITPHRLSGKNEPRDYSITSTSDKPLSSTIIYRSAHSAQVGISGVAVTIAPNSDIVLRTLDLPDDSIDYRFTRIVAFHDSLSPIISLRNQELSTGTSSDIFNSFTTEINLLQATDSVTLRTSIDGKFADGPIYGFSLENDSPGVIYHSLGVNGACFVHWGREPEVTRQMSALNAQLIVISLGSNEASGSNFISGVFVKEMDNFVSNCVQASPNTPILLITPAQTMRRQGRNLTPNPNFELIHKAMLDYAAQKGIAILDIYAISSGNGSAAQWHRAGLLARDGIHFTTEGYTLQGLLLFNALHRAAKAH